MQTAAMPDSARVWIYQANRKLTERECAWIQPRLENFAREWVSHNRQLYASGNLLYDRFIVLAVDENHAGASGCSIDNSIQFIRGLGAELQVDFFDRWTFAYRDKDEIRLVAKEAFAELYRSGEIDDKTLVFDNLVSDKKAFIERWEVPLGKSWLRRFV